MSCYLFSLIRNIVRISLRKVLESSASRFLLVIPAMSPQLIHRITEYAEMEGTHKDRWVQLLFLQKQIRWGKVGLLKQLAYYFGRENRQTSNSTVTMRPNQREVTYYKELLSKYMLTRQEVLLLTCKYSSYCNEWLCIQQTFVFNSIQSISHF